jgi:uncharacterized membrane protein (DUF2068 family)
VGLILDVQSWPEKMIERKTHGRGVRLIAAFKILKGLATLALSIGVLKLLHRNVEAVAVHWIYIFQGDPNSHYMHLLLAKLAILDDRRLEELSAGTFIYSAIFLTGGIGLALGKRWAEYFTIFSTASLLPLELYELAKHASIGKGLALAANIAVVVYLIRELRRYPKQS